MNSSSSCTKLLQHLKHHKCHFHRNIYLLASILIVLNSGTIPFAACFFKCPLLLLCSNKKAFGPEPILMCMRRLFFWNLNYRNPKDIESYKSTLLLFADFFLIINFSKDFLTTISCNIQPTIHPFRSVLRIFFSSLFLTFPKKASCWSNNYNVQKCRTREEKSNKNNKFKSTHKLSVGSHNRMVSW